jgi:hypothetical protein
MKKLKQIVEENSVTLKKVTFKLSDFESYDMKLFINRISESYFYIFHKHEMWGRDLEVFDLRAFVKESELEITEDVREFLFDILSDIDLINIQV